MSDATSLLNARSRQTLKGALKEIDKTHTPVATITWPLSWPQDKGVNGWRKALSSFYKSAVLQQTQKVGLFLEFQQLLGKNFFFFFYKGCNNDKSHPPNYRNYELSHLVYVVTNDNTGTAQYYGSVWKERYKNA